MAKGGILLFSILILLWLSASCAPAVHIESNLSQMADYESNIKPYLLDFVSMLNGDYALMGYTQEEFEALQIYGPLTVLQIGEDGSCGQESLNYTFECNGVVKGIAYFTDSASTGKLLVQYDISFSQNLNTLNQRGLDYVLFRNSDAFFALLENNSTEILIDYTKSDLFGIPKQSPDAPVIPENLKFSSFAAYSASACHTLANLS